MRNKNMLHKSKLEDFKRFVKFLGYDITEGKASCEVARFKIPSNPMGIIFEGKSSDHYSVNNAAMPFVDKFIATNGAIKAQPKDGELKKIKPAMSMFVTVDDLNAALVKWHEAENKLIKTALQDLIDIAEKCDGWESFPSQALDDAQSAIDN